jgi:hypothetical protein
MRREFHVRFCEGGRVRFPSATRLIVGFQHESDARRFLNEMRERLAKFALSLHPEKTRIIEFGRLPCALRTRMDETKDAGPLIPKSFRIEFLARRRAHPTQRAGDSQLGRHEPAD